MAPTRQLNLSITVEVVCWILSKGLSQASIPGLAVLSRFQSSLVKSIFLVIGVLGGAAKLNQTFLMLR